MPLITVIMASYNHERFVGEAVASVLAQSFGDLELIVVDDASTDHTAGVFGEFDDPRISLHRLWVSRERNPRNVALEHAQGELIAIQNSDDVWAENKLQAQVDYLGEHPECGAVFSAVQLIDENGDDMDQNWFAVRSIPRHKWLRYFFLHGNAVCHPSVLMRRALVEDAGGYHPLLALMSDFDLWVRLAGRAELHILPDKLTRMRVMPNEGNFSAQRVDTQRRHFFEYQEVMRRYSEAPLISQIEQIFPEITESYPQFATPAVRQYALSEVAMYGGTPWHRAFAIDLQSQLLKDPESREQIVAATDKRAVSRFMRHTSEIPLGLGFGTNAAKLYWSKDGEFSEKACVERKFEWDKPQNLTFNLSPVQPGFRLSFAPGIIPGRYHIAALTLTNAGGGMLWQLNAASGFDAIDLNGTRRGHRRDVFEFIDFGDQPSILLPPITDGAEETVILRVRQSYAPNIAEFAKTPG